MATKAKKPHAADLADIEAVKTATSFNVHLRRSPTSKINEPAATLAEAVVIADRIAKEHPGRKPLIYAILPTGATVPVPQVMLTASRKGDFEDAAPAQKRIKLPKTPDFSAPTHARFRKKLAEVVALAKAGDLKALKAFQINPCSTSPKAIARYRDAAIEAIQAARKGAAA